MPDRTGPSSREGATLVEIIVALGIAVLIVSVIVLAHHTLTLNSRTQIQRIRKADRALTTISTLRKDLEQLYAPDFEPACSIELANTDDQLARLAFCRWESVQDPAAPATNRLEHIVYTVETSGAEARLMRTIAATTGPNADEPYVTNWINGAWTRLTVELYDGAQWITSWPDETAPTAAAGLKPVAARIRLYPENADAGQEQALEHESIVVIPSALSVTSTATRISSAITAP